MTDISLPFEETKTAVHSEEALRTQRFRALAKDQCALSGVSLYGQLVIGLSLYLYPFVSTPGYLSILLTLPFLLFLSLSARRILKNTPPGENLLLFTGGKGLGKIFAFFFALIFFLDSLLAAYALTAMMETVLPDMSALLISLSVTAVPQTVVTLCSVGRFVINKEHIALFARNIGNHSIAPSPLLYMPYDLRVGLRGAKLSSRKRPEFREIELVAFALVIVSREKLAF